MGSLWRNSSSRRSEDVSYDTGAGPVDLVSVASGGLPSSTRNAGGGRIRSFNFDPAGTMLVAYGTIVRLVPGGHTVGKSGILNLSVGTHLMENIHCDKF